MEENLNQNLTEPEKNCLNSNEQEPNDTTTDIKNGLISKICDDIGKIRKECNKCGIEKNIDDFCKDKSKKDGYHTICKLCSSNSKRERRVKNKIIISDEELFRIKEEKAIKRTEYLKNYNLKNKSSIKEKSRLRYIKDKEKQTEHSRVYYTEHKELIREQRKLNKLKTSEYKKSYAIKNKEILKETRRINYIKNKEIVAIKGKLYRLKNKELLIERKRKYYTDNKDARQLKNRLNYYKNREKQALYYKNNREKVNRSRRELKAKSPKFKIACNLRTRLYCALKRNSKLGSAVKDLGISIDDFIIYLKSKFELGMTMENYGKVWHIDHNIPLDVFDLTNLEEFRKACHYTNLYPRWATTKIARDHGSTSIGNIDKGNKIINQDKER